MVFIKPNINIISTEIQNDETKIIQFSSKIVPSHWCTQTTYHLVYSTIDSHFKNAKNKIVVGDFNSRLINWGYDNTDYDGELIKQWLDLENMNLVHDPKLPPSFASDRWKRRYNHDLILLNDQLKHIAKPVPFS